ncbi:MAG: SDR family NAD(P)-dependent oxidoreductase [Alphaproteobacteria bacterium]
MGKRVLVTGGARGIGAGIVRRLAGEGYEVVFTYNSSKGPADTLIAEIEAETKGAKLSARGCDMSERAAVESLAKELEAEGGFYGFVHNAGKSYDALAAMVDIEAADVAMQVNFWATVRIVRAMLRSMMRAREGRIVFIGSVTALRGNPGNAIYAASKAALLGYTRTVAVEIARRNVTVNFISPGYVDTEMLEPYADFRETLEKQIPNRRYATPADIGGVVNFLMSDDGGYITGVDLPVDGGLTASLGIQR